jgi:AI-2 transport protein TqsA
MVKVAERVRTYLLQMLILSAVTGGMVGAILYLLGVNFALSFGFLAFILNFLPTLGSIIATLLPLPVILLDDSLTPLAQTMAFVLPAMVQFIIGNVIQPRIQGQAQGLHPVAVLLALIVFGTMWGTAGALLAVPLTSALKIAFERIPGAEPFARLLAGQLA